MSETWTWRCDDADGRPTDDMPATAFLTQADAEAWLSQEWQTLHAAGVDHVTLCRDDAVVYGPMSLHELT